MKILQKAIQQNCPIIVNGNQISKDMNLNLKGEIESIRKSNIFCQLLRKSRSQKPSSSDNLSGK